MRMGKFSVMGQSLLRVDAREKATGEAILRARDD